MNTLNLKRAREQMGINQKQLAERLGVAPQSYNHYETGKREPDNEMLIRIANVLEVSTNYLLGVPDPPPPNQDDEFWDLRQEMVDKPEMRALFSLAKTADKETLEFAGEMIKRMRKESGYSDE